jgi:hypothetical protein
MLVIVIVVEYKAKQQTSISGLSPSLLLISS